MIFKVILEKQSSLLVPISRNLEILSLLMSEEGGFEVRDATGATLLHYLSKGWLKNIDGNIITQLIARVSDVDAQDQKGRSLLHIAVQNRNMSLICSLITQGASRELRNRHGKTAFELAIDYDLIVSIESLIPDGNSIDVRRPDGLTTLNSTAQIGNLASIDALIRRGVSLEVRLPGTGKTPLHIAAENGNAKAISKLLEHGADMKAITCDGKFFRMLAAEWEKQIATEERKKFDSVVCRDKALKRRTLADNTWKRIEIERRSSCTNM